MSRAAWLAATLVSLAGSTAAAQVHGDNLADLRQRLARAEQQAADIKRADSLERAAVHDQRRGQLVATATVPLVVWRSIPQAVAETVAESASAMIVSLGVVPQAALDSLVLVQMWTSDIDALQALPALRGRRIRIFEEVAFSDTSRVIWSVASAILRSWTRSLDTTWKAWGANPQLGWSRDREGVWAQTALTNSADEVGKGCLAADLRDCRRWLGLDADEHPYRARYRGSDLRRRLASTGYWFGPRLRQSAQGEIKRCQEGDDETCFRLMEEAATVDPVPAPDIARSGMLEAVRELHGPEALRAALLIRTGSLGDRLAGASRISVDSLAHEWRTWALARGRVDRVRAGPGDAIVVVLTMVLMVALATRSGRWR